MLVRRIEQTCLFDRDFYLAAYPDVREAGCDPILHFLRAGAREGRMPNPLFDPAFYVRTYPDVAQAGANPLVHYLESGAREGRNPHPLFDTDYYLRQCPDVARFGLNPLAHYLEHGAREGRNPNPYFDPAYYCRANPDAARAPNPLYHFCSRGAAEGKRPSPLFDPLYYLQQNPDVKAAGVNPLAHFVLTGDREERRPCALFDPEFYLNEYPEVRATGLSPLAHYLEFGMKEGCAINRARVPVHAGQKMPASRRREIEAEIELFRTRPRISVLVPVYNQTQELLERMIASVEAQVYPDWELCIADDGSTSVETIRTLGRYIDPHAGRINIAFLGRNLGISGATNAALYLSSGDYVALLDHDDELAPEALFEVAKALNEDSTLDVTYSDENKLSPEGWLDQPFHKPGWSPELFRQVMYVGHLLCVRRSLALEVRGMDRRFDGVQDYDFMLRVSERSDRIRHIPSILYHWRRVPGSIALGEDEKPGMAALQAAAVNADLNRRRVPAYAEPHPWLAHRTVIRPLPRRERPRVSIVIPTRDQPRNLDACLRSIFEKTTYPNFEVLLVDNDTTDPEALRVFEHHPVTVVPFSGQFNYSRANNLGVAKAGGEYLVLLNNDTEVITPDWIEQLLYYIAMPDVGAVSPLLLYPEQSVQHAGVVLGMRGTADHIMRGFPADSDGYFGSLSCAHEVSAVSAACMALRRETYIELGGFREEFRTIYQDVDFCLRLRARGMRILYTPRASLYHQESLSRGNKYDPLDRALLLDFWGKVIADGDPYFNCNLDMNTVSAKLLKV
ncbi:MAG: glycosyltransferase family 2 protein [Candidatus Sulfopaludibacter sp.]|nr:glycosyltransferase family 2 protein [Candidatus Sulfopaludibacter sp.]